MIYYVTKHYVACKQLARALVDLRMVIYWPKHVVLSIFVLNTPDNKVLCLTVHNILYTHITNSSNHKVHLSIYIVHRTWRKVFRSKHQTFCIFTSLFIVEMQPQISYLWNTLSSDVKYCLHVNKDEYANDAKFQHIKSHSFVPSVVQKAKKAYHSVMWHCCL